MAGLICNNFDVAIMSKYPFLMRVASDKEGIYETTLDKLLNNTFGSNSASLVVYNDKQASLNCSSLIGQIDLNKWMSTA